MNRIHLLPILLFPVLFSCTSEYAVEDEIYTCIEQEFADHSLNLEEELDTLETLFLSEDLLQSASPEDYRNYYQENINQGMLRSLKNPYAHVKFNKIELSFDKLETYALRTFDGETFDQSKFGKISHMIDTMVQSTGQIASSTVAKAHLTFLSADDFEHPFYRANILLSLQHLYFQKHMKLNVEHLREIPRKLN